VSTFDEYREQALRLGSKSVLQGVSHEDQHCEWSVAFVDWAAEPVRAGGGAAAAPSAGTLCRRRACVQASRDTFRTTDCLRGQCNADASPGGV